MTIKYSRLSNGEFGSGFDIVKWSRNNIPIAFLRQQTFLVSIVISSFILFIFTTLFTSNVDYELIQDTLDHEFSYGVIVDCGSSGSRAHIFKWKKESLLHKIDLVRDPKDGMPLTKHITPGVSSLKNNPDRASDYMEPIMDFISNAVPQDRHFDTPVYFMATAGLRLLEDSTQRRILDDLTKDLRVKYNFPKIKSQVISGEFEGIYSWLSLNMNKKLYNTSLATKSYGMIEMGGASTQVTFELNPEVENNILKELKSTEVISAFKSEQKTLNLGSSNSVKLFATTFLGLGVNTARGAAIDLLVLDRLKKDSDNIKLTEIRVEDPCLTSGSSEIVSRPTILLQNTHQTIGFVIRENEKTFTVHLEGTGNFLQCMNLLDRMLLTVKQEKLNCQKDKPCSMDLLGTNFIPFSSYPFVGLSEMYFTTNEMMKSAGLFDRAKILHETKKICETEYNRLLELYANNGVTHKDRILYECFKASWLLTILHTSGFRMPETYENFRTLNRLGDQEIDRTIGAMVTEVSLSKVNPHRH